MSLKISLDTLFWNQESWVLICLVLSLFIRLFCLKCQFTTNKASKKLRILIKIFGNKKFNFFFGANFFFFFFFFFFPFNNPKKKMNFNQQQKNQTYFNQGNQNYFNQGTQTQMNQGNQMQFNPSLISSSFDGITFCDNMENYLSQISNKYNQNEFHDKLEMIVKRIFEIMKNIRSKSEYLALKKLLSSDKTFISLLQKSNRKYEFPLEFLPKGIKEKIEEMMDEEDFMNDSLKEINKSNKKKYSRILNQLSAFYNTRVQRDSSRNIFLVNAIEFYLFQFAHFGEKSSIYLTETELSDYQILHHLYLSLLEDYQIFFYRCATINSNSNKDQVYGLNQSPGMGYSSGINLPTSPVSPYSNNTNKNNSNIYSPNSQQSQNFGNSIYSSPLNIPLTPIHKNNTNNNDYLFTNYKNKNNSPSFSSPSNNLNFETSTFEKKENAFEIYFYILSCYFFPHPVHKNFSYPSQESNDNIMGNIFEENNYPNQYGQLNQRDWSYKIIRSCNITSVENYTIPSLLSLSSVFYLTNFLANCNALKMSKRSFYNRNENASDIKRDLYERSKPFLFFYLQKNFHFSPNFYGCFVNLWVTNFFFWLPCTYVNKSR